MPVWAIILCAFLAPSGVIGTIIGLNEVRYRRNRRLHEAGKPHNCLERHRLRRADDRLWENYQEIRNEFA